VVDVAVAVGAGPDVGAVAVGPGAAGGAVAAGPGPFSARGTVVVVAAPAGPGAGCPAGEPPDVEGVAGFWDALAPSGMAAGGGTAARRPAPASTPAKNSREATRTPAATFTYESASTAAGAGSTGAEKR